MAESRCLLNAEFIGSSGKVWLHSPCPRAGSTMPSLGLTNLPANLQNLQHNRTQHCSPFVHAGSTKPFSPLTNLPPNLQNQPHNRTAERADQGSRPARAGSTTASWAPTILPSNFSIQASSHRATGPDQGILGGRARSTMPSGRQSTLSTKPRSRRRNQRGASVSEVLVGLSVLVATGLSEAPSTGVSDLTLSR